MIIEYDVAVPIRDGANVYIDLLLQPAVLLPGGLPRFSSVA
jgi:hypothetical protein